jgi:hypothetical protein
VMGEASSEARNATAAAIPHASAKRPLGMPAVSWSSFAAGTDESRGGSAEVLPDRQAGTPGSPGDHNGASRDVEGRIAHQDRPATLRARGGLLDDMALSGAVVVDRLLSA